MGNGLLFRERVTDYHCHILPGIDDGPETREGSMMMAQIFADAGYREIYCTTHLIKGRYEATISEILNERSKLQAELDREGIGIKLLVGREHYLDEFLLDQLKQPLLLEGTNFLSVEIPSLISFELVKEILFQVTCRGYVPFIAHPERCDLLELSEPVENNFHSWYSWFTKEAPLAKEISLLEYLRNLGCQFQANVGSFNGLYGKFVQKKAERFEKAGLYTHLGTDAHNPEHLKTILKSLKR